MKLQKIKFSTTTIVHMCNFFSQQFYKGNKNFYTIIVLVNEKMVADLVEVCGVFVGVCVGGGGGKEGKIQKKR